MQLTDLFGLHQASYLVRVAAHDQNCANGNSDDDIQGTDERALARCTSPQYARAHNTLQAGKRQVFHISFQKSSQDILAHQWYEQIRNNRTDLAPYNRNKDECIHCIAPETENTAPHDI